MSKIWKSVRAFLVRCMFHGSVFAISRLTWLAFGSIISAWIIYLKPGFALPLIHFRAHPDYIAYLLFPAVGSLVVLLLFALGLRRFAAHHCPELDRTPTPSEAITTLVGVPLLLRLLVGLVTLCVRWSGPHRVARDA